MLGLVLSVACAMSAYLTQFFYQRLYQKNMLDGMDRMHGIEPQTMTAYKKHNNRVLGVMFHILGIILCLSSLIFFIYGAYGIYDDFHMLTRQ
jgi:hypothetical protein